MKAGIITGYIRKPLDYVHRIVRDMEACVVRACGLILEGRYHCRGCKSRESTCRYLPEMWRRVSRVHDLVVPEAGAITLYMHSGTRDVEVRIVFGVQDG